MKIIIGLGNPDSKYTLTRHNIGFLYLDWLNHKFFQNQNFQTKSKLKSNIIETSLNSEKIILAKPNTYMNLSGDAFIALQNFYKIDTKDILVIYDDIDIEFNTFRYREKGSAGTHNGMRSVIQNTNTQEIPRLRLGISNQFRQHIPLSEFVLSNFSKDEQNKLPEFFESTLQTLQNANFL